MDSPTTGKLGYIAWLVITVLVILFSMNVDTFIDTKSANSSTDDLQFKVITMMCLFGLFVCANFLTSTEARVFMSRFYNFYFFVKLRSRSGEALWVCFCPA